MFKFCWHKWKYVYSLTTNMFLGENCPRLEKKFRVCTKCGKSQEFVALYDRCDWETLSECETKVLLGKVVDKGDHFLLKKTHDSRSL